MVVDGHVRWFGVLCLSFAVGCMTGPAAEDLSAEVTYFVDASDTITAEEIARYVPRFQHELSAEFEGTSTPYWARLVLPRARLSAHAVLMVNARSVYAVELYRRGHAAQRAGHFTPLREHSVQHPHNVFVVNFEGAEQEVELFFKVRGPRPWFPLVGWPQPEFLSAAMAGYFELGLFFGAMAIMAGYNLFLAYALRRRAYAYYALYTLSLAFFVSVEERLVLHVTSGGHTYFITSLCTGLVPFAGLLFTRAFLQVPQLAPRLDRLFVAQVVLAVPMTFSGLFIEGNALMLLLSLVVLVAIVTWATAVVIALRAGHRPARYMAVAIGITLFIGTLTALIGARVIPDFPARLALFRFGVVFEQLILSLGVADLYREVQRERLRERLANLEEREQLQREVHDTVASDIQVVLMSLPEAHDTRPVLQRALANARDFAALLQMSRQTQQPLGQALDTFVRTLRQQPGCSADLRFDAALDGAPARLRLQLFRIFQEWMSNCLRHAKATRFRIELVRRRGPTRPIVVLRIQSNGAAFAWRSQPGEVSVGTGLDNIRYRCDKIAARALARAGRDGGSNFVLRAPL